MLPHIYDNPEHPYFQIPSFSFMLMIASLAGTLIAYKMAKRRGLSQVAILDLAIVGTIMALVGGRLFHVFFDIQEISFFPDAPVRHYYFKDPIRIFKVWQGGWTSLGAIIGLAVGWTTYAKIKKLDVLHYLDHMCLFAGPFVIFFVRFGCLLAGCCFGAPNSFDQFEFILYINLHGAHRWPTQIYSMAYGLLIFALCYWVESRQKFKGQVTLVFLMSYAVFRSLVELLRADVDRGVYFNNTVSTAQIVSALGLTIGITLYFYFRKAYPMTETYRQQAVKTLEAAKAN